ncbi:sulfotransferase 2B1-like [Ochotona curzoniae]|uniref:sulfotransferase 2B1-like n=1 Tax=Ochotona curzoniae TaxID=130825 RepID=UPI001B346AEE|nr:sulfotransferase 2B1-like [Ochotona curzoniae]
MSRSLDSEEVFDGIRFPGFIHTPESLQAACSFQFQDTDVLLVTFPKSGTTWMQQILSLIFCKGDLWPIHHRPNWARMPWLEHISFQGFLAQWDPTQSRLLTTHLHAKALAPALKKSKARVVYMARHPKDVLVSFYHFHRMASFLPDPSSFQDFMDEFLEGTGFYSSWFDHVKGWLSLLQDLNMLLITYEELHQEPRSTLQKLARFLGHPLSPQEEDMVLHHSSFAFMSQSSVSNYSLVPREVMDQARSSFMRKGVVGDWQEHFTPEQNAKFNAVYQAQMKDCSLHLPWTMD